MPGPPGINVFSFAATTAIVWHKYYYLKHRMAQHSLVASKAETYFYIGRSRDRRTVRDEDNTITTTATGRWSIIQI